jgi:hypothetical protein
MTPAYGIGEDFDTDQRLAQRFPPLAVGTETALFDLLDCLGAAAALRAGLADPTVVAALAWLDALSDEAAVPHVGLVVPASREWFDTNASIIRLRPSGDGMWALPVAVHEYGHFVATQLRHRFVADDSIPDYLDAVEDQLRIRARAAEIPAMFRKGHELFADAFATYVAGPTSQGVP